MVTKVSAFEQPMEIYGKSTDSKPTDVLNGSIFVEMDTSSIYVFDGATSTWLPWSA